MATTSILIEPVILSQHWKKNGTNFYRIRIVLHGQRKFLKTNILVRRENFGRGGKLISAPIRHKLEDLVREIETTVSRIDTYALKEMTVNDVATFIERSQSGEFHLDFFKFAEEVISKKGTSSASGYTSAIRSFREFVGKDDLDIAEITSSLLRQWEQWLREKYGNEARAVTAYTAALRYIHGQARARYNNEEFGQVPIRNPFQFYKPPCQKPAAHRAVDAAIIEKMLEMRGNLTGRERLGVDVFLLSFALMGMNSPDLYTCAPPKDGIITYNRTKTKGRRADRAEMRVKIDPLVLPLASEYFAGDPAFTFSHRYSSYQIFGENVNEGLKAFCKRIGQVPALTLYSARHTWASVAYRSKIDKGVINDCLCHVDKTMKVTDIYIDKDWSVMWDANHKVLEQFQWQLEHPSSQMTSAKARAESPAI